ncbi:DEAD/DEAH box helicase family protein [Streptomyces sp. NPDC058611]|uniref:DEAD/DEAH box helicase family protein n=1 Tax=unclassified Streptomyces TaxID=2593676 RepID=UPI003666F981
MLTPRPHQREAAAAALAHLTHGARATVVAACGTGKTLMAALVAEGLKARRGPGRGPHHRPARPDGPRLVAWRKAGRGAAAA